LIAHWDELPPDADLAQAAGAVAVSLRRFQLAPGEQVELPQRETEDVPLRRRRQRRRLRAGDCVVYPVPHEPAALRAGDDGLTALLFATPAKPPPFHSGAAAAPRTINLADADSAYEGEAGRWVLLARQAARNTRASTTAGSRPGTTARRRTATRPTRSCSSSSKAARLSSSGPRR
jgi:hypothetical protein